MEVGLDHAHTQWVRREMQMHCLLMCDYHDREHDVITLSTHDGSQLYKLGIDVHSPQFRLWTTLRGKFLYCMPPAT